MILALIILAAAIALIWLSHILLDPSRFWHDWEQDHWHGDPDD